MPKFAALFVTHIRYPGSLTMIIWGLMGIAMTSLVNADSLIDRISLVDNKTSAEENSPGNEKESDQWVGWWSARLKCPGGWIEFEIEINHKDSAYVGWIVNGNERINISEITIDQSKLNIGFPHYDSKIQANLEKSGALKGKWVKYLGENPEGKPKTDSLVFEAEKGKRKFEVDGAEQLAGRYLVQFESSKDPAIGDFANQKTFVGGTFLTTTGDYRYLAGSYVKSSRRLKLSCFDGGHAFLFTASHRDDKLIGDFWSRGSWHEGWTATRKPDAKLPDGFDQVQWANVATSQLSFPDEHGKLWNLADPKLSGKIKIIQVFGSWCPNCHDASTLLSKLESQYGKEGLKIVGLAFELTNDQKRNARQIQRYRDRTGAGYPILIAGLADKKKATKQLQILSKVKSYPTTIFLDDSDRPIAIHSGFTGPATGDAYVRLEKKFRTIIERQLATQ